MSERSVAATGRVQLNTRRLRIVGWAFLPVFLSAYWVSAGRPWPFIGDVFLMWGAYATPILISAVLCAVCSRRASGLERRFWVLLAVANGALFLSECSYAWWLLVVDPLGPSRIALPFQPLHLVAAIAFLGVLSSMTQLSSASTASRIRYMSDMCVAALVMYVFALEFYARPLMSPSAEATWEILVGAVYPVVAILMLLGVVVNVAGLKVTKWRSWEKLVVVAMAVYLGGVFMWPSWYASAAGGASHDVRNVLDLLQLTGHYVLLMATVYRLTEDAEWFPRPLPPITLGKRRWVSLAFPLSALAATAMAAAAAYASRGEGAWPVIYGAIAVLLMALVLVRSSLLALEHSTLFHRSITDPLTGLYNHRYFHDHLAEQAESARRFNDVTSLVILDIDDFGNYNTLYGHGGGDRLLVTFAELLVAQAKRGHAVSRIGGDEFAIVLSNTAAPEAHLFAQTLVDHLSIEAGEIPGAITVSAGVASLPEHADTPEDLFRLADCAMLWAKERGKNRAVLFEAGRVPDIAGRERIEHIQRQSRVSSVRALAAAVDARDSATQNHSRHVAKLAVSLGELTGIEGEHLRLLELAALMHDVGKIGLPDAILLKPGRLDAEETRRVHEHAVLGARILSSTDLPEILPWVKHHHERWDGTGYPSGLRADEIPLESRILAICDAYDAMTSDRPYRAALSLPAALQEIDLNMGTQFDPVIAETFIQVIGRAHSEPIVLATGDGAVALA